MSGIGVPARALVVSRDLEIRRRVIHAISEEPSGRFGVEEASDTAAAVARLREGGIAVVLVRLQPPDGIGAIEAVRRAAPDVPVVAVLATGDERAVEAISAAGATDFVSEEHLDGEVLRRTLRYAIDRHRLEGEMHRRAVLDETTGVYNARGFEQIAEHHLRLSDRSNEPVVLVFVRVAPGAHEDPARAEALVGDAGGLLRAAVRDADVVGRLGPDTFAVLLTGNARGAEPLVLSRIVESVAVHNARRGAAELALSIGSTTYLPEHPSSLADLIRSADAEMGARTDG